MGEIRGVAITFFADLKHPTICLKVLLFNRPFRRQLDQESVEMIYFIAEFKSWGYLRFSNRNHDVERVVKIDLLRIKKGGWVCCQRLIEAEKCLQLRCYIQ